MNAVAYAAYGSIPACAGEPARATAPLSLPGVYPRVCGGTGSILTNVPHSTGLSPRVRGNPVVRAGGF